MCDKATQRRREVSRIAPQSRRYKDIYVCIFMYMHELWILLIFLEELEEDETKGAVDMIKQFLGMYLYMYVCMYVCMSIFLYICM